MKKTVVLGVGLVLALTACGSSDGGGSDKGGSGGGGSATIAWIAPDATTSTRWDTQDRPAFEAAVAKLDPKAEVIASTAHTDAEMQQAAEAAIARGADVIVINPITADGALPVVDLAARDKIPVISYEGLIADADLAGYITFNNVAVGKLQAQYIADHVPSGSTIAVMNGAQVCAACIDFKKGAHEVLDPLVTDGTLKIGYEADTPDWLTANAQKQTEQALTKLDDDVAAVYAANDGLAEGVIAALKARDLNGKVVVTGQDATLAGLQEILLGNQTMTVYKDFIKQAGAAAQAAVALAQGKDDTGLSDTFQNGDFKVPALFLQPEVVDKANVKMLVDNGFVSRDDLCSGEVASSCDF